MIILHLVILPTFLLHYEQSNWMNMRNAETGDMIWKSHDGW